MRQSSKLSRYKQTPAGEAAFQVLRRTWVGQLGAGLILTSGLALWATSLHTLPELGLFSP